MTLLDAAGVMNGDIWCSDAFSFDSPLKDLLESGEYTLEQLLAEDELLQELRGLHPQLIDFFSSEEAVAGLIQYIILPPKTKTTMTTTTATATKADNVADEKTVNEASNDDDDDNEMIDEQENTSEYDGTKQEEEAEAEEVTTTKEPGKWLQGDDPVVAEEEDITRQQKSVTQQEEKDDLNVRFPYMACEVICCEITGVIDILMDGFVPLLCEDDTDDHDDDDDNNNEVDGEETKNNRSSSASSSQQLVSNDARGKPMLDLLFSILYDSKTGEIDDYRAGYFEKILSILLTYRPKDVAQYLNDGGGKGNLTLMSAMFKHLYSHSLMQIVQRLLLPRPPIPPSKNEGEGESEGGEPNECEDLFNDTMEDGLNSFRCNWSESELALQMLLDCLIDDESSKTKTTTSIEQQIEDGGDDGDDDDEEEERKLNFYQNTSEVLITIIQNSPLTSLTMRTLTTDPVLEKLILAATYVKEGSKFSRHDSRLTCAMNVLESLILQLGGYGSVGTMIYDEEEENGQGVVVQDAAIGEVIVDDEKAMSEELGGESGASATATTTTTTSQHQVSPSTTNTIQNYATPETLIHHLPTMLSFLSNLLTYPGAEQWISPMQFSRTKPQKILGSSRLRIVRLLESLVLLGNPNIDSLLCESRCLEVCLDLFWKFQWCSMLHQSVANLLVHVFEGQNSRSELQSYFLVKCNLLGRLMYSFWDEVGGGIASIVNDPNAEVSESIMGQKDSDSENSPTTSSVISEKGSSTTNDVLPVSDDDVDAAMEQQQDSVVSIDALEDTAGSKYPDESMNENGMENNRSVADHDDVKEPTFRLGYMGHVIIICQALVHACTEEKDNDSPSIKEADDLPEEMGGEPENFVNDLSGHDSQEPSKQDEELDDAEAFPNSSADEYPPSDDNVPSDSLMLAQLVKKHPLGKIWQDFVLSTLASETALQTTPLGGFQASTLGTDPFHMHRPGLEDDGGYDDDDDDGNAPALPQRGLLVDGDVIDMDDNDLDVAASMMAGLNIGQVADNHGENQTQSNAPHQNGYIFDDPLGGGRFGEFDDDDGDGDSSSDEEPEMLENTGGSDSAVVDGVSSENEAPVMDLFAGNFDAFGETAAAGDQPSGNWSDFANFDDAFAGAQNADDNPCKEEKNNFDSIFGDVKSHDILLDELEKTASPENGTFPNDDLTAIEVEASADQPEDAGL